AEEWDDESPAHRVYLPDYRIGKYPVTNAQFERFVRATGYQTAAERAGESRSWRQPQGPGSHIHEKRNHPVVRVTWSDAVAYAHWAGQRLPTEAEWEKAARGADGRIYPWGNEFDASKCNTPGNGIDDTTPVRRYAPQGDSPYGVSDMAGNVWEWCSSLYKPYPYQANDGREDSEAGGARVVRSGSFAYDLSNARCAHRNRADPDALYSDIGFRIATSVPPMALVGDPS
ncbi:MAG: formylglycine-generating enzyme family protein, partial [Anaerolineae bacterium]